jgi:hypothetical protein
MPPLFYVRRIDSGNLLAGRGFDPLVVDEQTSRLSPSVAVGGCELNRCIGHGEDIECGYIGGEESSKARNESHSS